MDNDHEDLNDKEDLFETLIAEMLKKYEKKRNTSNVAARFSPPPEQIIPAPPQPDEELLLAESDGEQNFESGESLDEWDSL